MAQAQAGASRRRSPSAKQKGSARSRGSSSKATTKRSSNNTKRSANKQRQKPTPVSVVENTAKDAGKTAMDAGKTVGRAASKAKVPLLAGGAALAGAAGGLALGAHQARRHKGLGKGVGKVHADDLAKAARKVGDVGVQIGELALEGRRAREASNGSVHRSPVEVVLEGLTSRRNKD